MMQATTPSPAAPALGGRDHLYSLLIGQVVAQALSVAARLGLADLLAAGPRSIEALAQSTGTDPGALLRLVRSLAGVGVVREVAPCRFALTDLGDCLRDDRPDSARPPALLFGEVYRRGIDGLLESVRSGEASFHLAAGQPFFDYLSANPEIGALFDRNMATRHRARAAAIIDAYDFSGIARLVDVGGGTGGTVRAVMTAYPTARGVVFDLPAVVERATATTDPDDDVRPEFTGGSFFDALPAGADRYLLSSILHDWNDERAGAILATVRRAIAPEGRVLIVEAILPPGDAPSPARWLDLLMLVLNGGKERTEAHFRQLLAAAGFAVTRIIPTSIGDSIIEARPIDVATDRARPGSI
jgi:hypothetical protein